MKCPSCGELWFDSDDEYSIEPCERCNGSKVELPTDDIETDAELRTRIANAYGMWGAFLSVVIESHGTRLDECAKHVGLTRLRGAELLAARKRER